MYSITDDIIPICGGDGTLDRFINNTKGILVCNPIFYYAVGSGNNFIRDLNKQKGFKPDLPINLLTKWANGERYFYGHEQFEQTHAIISSGAGLFQPPVKIGTSNEVVEIRIQL